MNSFNSVNGVGAAPVYREPPLLVSLIARFRQGGIGCQFADDSDPGGLTSLPGALVLTAYIGPVDQLIAVGRRAADRYRQGRVAGGLEAHRDLAKVQIHVRDVLPGLGGNGVQAERVVAAGDQIGRQHLIGGGVVGLVEDTVVQPGTVCASGKDRRPGRVGGNAIMPIEIL